LGIVVGDSLHRDIVFGNQAGMITVYKPSTYLGMEIPQAPEEKPFAVINTLADLPALLRRLDVQVPPLAEVPG
jgi:FMN phosphatase YigB (HAD superfamily)